MFAFAKRCPNASNESEGREVAKFVHWDNPAMHHRPPDEFVSMFSPNSGTPLNNGIYS